MTTSEPSGATPWRPLTPEAVVDLFVDTPARWWLSGGVALDHWLGQQIRERTNVDVSTTSTDVARLVASLPPRFSAWTQDGGRMLAWADVPIGADLQNVLIRENAGGAWVVQVNVEDGTERAWVYKRDPRLQLPWDRAVLDVGGIPTGAPEVQLVWKALRPRPGDDVDKDAVLPELSDDARAWWERCILSIHPHSSWSIHVRSPLTPAKASWNRRAP